MVTAAVMENRTELGAAPQLAQGATAPSLVRVTITHNGETTTQTLDPAQTLTALPGMGITLDAAGVVLDVTVDGDNILFTNPETGEIFTFEGLASFLTEETATLGFYNNTTGTVDVVSIEDVLAGVQTAAAGGGGGDGGGFSTANQFQDGPFGSSGDQGDGPGAGGNGAGAGTGTDIANTDQNAFAPTDDDTTLPPGPKIFTEGSDSFDFSDAGGDDVEDGNYTNALGGNDVVTLPNIDDTLNSEFAKKTFDAGSGNDVITGGNDNDTINGGEGNDTLDGADGDDTFMGGAGNDIINGGDASEQFPQDGERPNPGTQDTVDYSASPSGVDINILDGTATGEGTDTLSNIEVFVGSLLDDIITGGSVNDGDPFAAYTIFGNDGDDTLAGIDFFPTVIFGGPGNDEITGGFDRDTLEGGENDDSIVGFEGEDVLRGGDGGDVLIGDTTLTEDERDEAGLRGNNDTISGGNGSDILWGGGRSDTLDGGAGEDFFIYQRGDGGEGNLVDGFRESRVDIIKNFDIDEDTIILTGGLTADDIAFTLLPVLGIGDGTLAHSGMVITNAVGLPIELLAIVENVDITETINVVTV
jgi:Ca2+-binding RTX toxin-like protein